MKIEKYILSIMAVLTTAYCFAGNGTSGGGAQIESAFRLRGTELIAMISASPAADALCSSSAMKNALDLSEIRVVSQLVNPSTHQPISEQELDAYTSPGVIQLLKNSWNNFFNSGFPKNGKSVDALIIHEIYRATGQCNDEKFVISDQIPALLSQPNKYSKVYKFESIVDSEYSPAVNVACETAITNSTKNSVCMIMSRFLEQDDIQFAVVPITFKKTKFQIGADAPLVFARGLSNNLYGRLKTLFNLINPEHPFYVVSDLQTGDLSVGFDMTKLIRLN